MMRGVIAAILLLLCARPAAAQPAKISLGYVLAGDFITAFVAKERGFFLAHGLDVTMVKVPLATDVPPALLSSSLDIGMSTSTILVQTAAGGLDLVAIEGVSRFFAAAPKVALVGRTGLDYHTAADLKGKTIGVPGIASAIDVGVKMWLLQNQVPVADVTFVETSFPQMHDVLAHHSVDAVAVLEPFLSRIVGDGTGVRLANFYDVAPDALSAIWIATRPWATAHRDLVERFRAALVDSQAFIEAHPDDSKPIEKQYLGYNSPIKPSISLTISPADFEFFNKALLSLHLIDHPVDTSRLVFR